jgi:hypothetical protein
MPDQERRLQRSNTNGTNNTNNNNPNANRKNNQQGAHPRKNSDDRKQSNQQRAPNPTIMVSDGRGGLVNIDKRSFIDAANSIKLSSDALAICNDMSIVSKDIIDISFRKIATQSSINVFSIIIGRKPEITPFQKACLTQYGINVGSQWLTTEIMKKIVYAKYNLYAASVNKNFTNELAEFTGFLAGVCMYYNFLDVQNFQERSITTQFCNQLCAPHTIEMI